MRDRKAGARPLLRAQASRTGTPTDARLRMTSKSSTGKEEHGNVKTVLTIDDSKVLRMMVARQLEPTQCRILEAVDGREGFETAKRERPDLILLDVTMPVMDGAQTLEAIRKDPDIAKTPVIMLTAESGKDLVVQLARLGVQGYIVKPFNAETFNAQVLKVLNALPTKSEDATPATAGAAAAAPLDPKIVLVVDDAERILERARELITDRSVVTATGGAQALTAFDEHRPATVVIDLAMPEMDGFQTLAELKRRGGAEARYVALSVRGDADAQKKALASGFAAVVEKPLQPEALLQTLGTTAPSAAPALEHHDGCPVLLVPDSTASHFGHFGSSARDQIRGIAEEGDDRVILDLASVRVLNAQVTRTIVTIIENATTLGLRTAVCSTDASIIESLKGVSEAAGAAYAMSRDAAVRELR